MRHAALCLALLGCGGSVEVAVCVRTATDDAPLDGASEIVLQARPSDGPRVLRSFPSGARELRLPELAFGSYLFSVEALGEEGQTLAFGVSPAVDVTEATRSTPCMYLASVGRFGRTAVEPVAAPSGPVVTEPERTSARILTAEGFLRYDHATGRFDRAAVSAALPPEGSVWASLARSRAVALTPDGTAVVLEGDTLLTMPLAEPPGELTGARAVAVGFSRVLVVGGASSDSELPATVATVRIVDLAQGNLEPLAGEVPVVDAPIIALGNGQFLVTGGNEGTRVSPVASDRIAVIDPQDGVVAQGTLDVPRYEHATVLAADNILVIGGRTDPSQRTSSIERLRLRAGALIHMAAPSGLLSPRAGHVAIEMGNDVLVVGGEADDPGAAATTERFRFTLDATELGADAGSPLERPVATGLYDGTVLVLGASPEGARGLVYRPDP